MKALQSTDNAQESNSETFESKATYRAPRLVALGTADGLVKAIISGAVLDSNSGNSRWVR